MGIYISGVKGLPEQVQANKEDIKNIKEEIEGIDFEQIRQLETQVGENTQDINNLEAAIGVQNQAINGLKDRADALESKTQLMSYNSDLSMTDFRNSIEVADDVYARNVRVEGDGSIVNTTQSGFHFKEGANDDTLTIANNDGATPHYLHFNGDGTLDIDGAAVGAKPLYQHNICLNGPIAGGVKNYVLFNIINDDATPFTLATITSYMQQHYSSNAWFGGLNCTGYIFDTNLILYIYYNNGLVVSNVNLQNAVAGIQNSNISDWAFTRDNVVQIA